MTGAATPEGTQESGGALREQLEAQIAQANAATQVATGVIAGKFDHVTAEDLKGVPLDQLETKAAELNTQRVADRQAIFEAEAKARGLDIETIGQAPSAPAGESRPNLEQLGELGGERLTNVDLEGLSGPELIRASLKADKAARTK